VSTDGGRSYASVAPPPLPPTAQRPAIANPNDAIVQADPSGGLHYTALVDLVVGQTPVGYEQAIPSVQTAVSLDGGSTWSANVLLTTHDASGAGAFFDRPWLAFGPRNVTYATFVDDVAATPQGGGLQLAVSRDGGSTFGSLRQVADTGLSGRPLVTASGALLVPFVVNATPSVARSTDQGATVRVADVPSPPQDEGKAEFFPSLAQARNGTLALAWTTDAGTLLLSRSVDDGATWSAPAVVAHGVAVSPWQLTSAQHDWIAYFTAGNATKGPADLHVSSLDAPGASFVAATGIEQVNRYPGNTDFAFVTESSAGALVVPWVDAQAKLVVAVGSVPS
jgi:hypothetical protein